jgi:hypothetical protein
MMAHPVGTAAAYLQSLVELAVEKDTTVVFPAPLMSTIEELGTFLAREKTAASIAPAPAPTPFEVPGPHGVTFPAGGRTPSRRSTASRPAGQGRATREVLQRRQITSRAHAPTVPYATAAEKGKGPWFWRRLSRD